LVGAQSPQDITRGAVPEDELVVGPISGEGASVWGARNEGVPGPPAVRRLAFQTLAGRQVPQAKFAPVPGAPVGGRFRDPTAAGDGAPAGQENDPARLPRL